MDSNNIFFYNQKKKIKISLNLLNNNKKILKFYGKTCQIFLHKKKPHRESILRIPAKNALQKLFIFNLIRFHQ